MYHNAPINVLYKPSLTIEKEGQSKIKYSVNTAHFHVGGYLHGSAIFKLLDDAAFFAAQSIEPDYFITTASFNSHFIRPVNKAIITGFGAGVKFTKTQIFADSYIENETGKIIAKGSGIFMKSNITISSLNTSQPTN